MKKILLITVSMLFSATALAHSGHSPFELSGFFAMIEHYFSSLYHVVAMLILSVAFIISAIIVSKRQQILSALLMTIGALGSILGMGILLS